MLMVDHKTTLCENLPYWEFFSEPFSHAVLADGSLAATLEVVPLDIDCFDENRINQLTVGLRSFANTLPEGFSAQIMVNQESDFSELIEQHRALRSSELEFLNAVDSNRIGDLEKLCVQGRIFRSKIFFSLRSEPPAKPNFFSVNKTKSFANDFGESYLERLQALGQAVRSAGSLLTSLGFISSEISQESLIGNIYRHLNPKRSAVTQTPILRNSCAIDPSSPREQLVFGDLVLDLDDFVLDQTRTRVLSLKTLPEVTYAGMMSGFLSLPFRYELVFSLNVPDQIKEMKSLEQRRRLAHSLAHSTSNRVSDLESESKLAQTTGLIREIIESGQKIFNCEMVLYLREENTAEGRKNLEARTKDTLARFKSLSGSEGLHETVAAWKIFKSQLPFAPVNQVRAKKLKTNNAVDFLPLYGSARGDQKPVALTETRLGSLYSIDPYSSRLSNFNQLCTGSSGSGKSFANNFLMLQQIARGTK
ncbi:MAG: hypothetical protein EOP06_15710, partial [Proteobacteria bacterium]